MPETAKRTARVPILGEDGRISDDYIPAAIGEGVESAEAAATRAETAAKGAQGSATAAGTSATKAQESATAAGNAKTAADTAQKGAESAKTAAETAKAAAEKAKTGAESAKDSAQTAASQAQQSATAAAESAANVADKFISSAQATTLEPGSQATASVADQVLTLGIPRGDKGDKGDTGEKGEPGDVSAVQTAEGSGLSVSTDEGTVTIDDSALRERIAELENQAANVVTGTSTGLVAHAEDAYAQKPREVRLKGKTWVNRWPVINSANNGVTVSTDETGLITVTGELATQTTGSYVSTAINSISAKKSITVLSSRGFPNGVYLFVSFYDSDNGVLPGELQVGFSSTTETWKSATVPANTAIAKVGVGVKPNTVLSSPLSLSFRVMLVDGTEAPDCFTPPASITSAQPENLVTAGKNLLRLNPDLAQSTVDGVTFTPQDDGGILVDGTASENAFFNLDFSNNQGTTPAPPAGTTVTQSNNADGVAMNVDVFLFDGRFVPVTMQAISTAVVPTSAAYLRSFIYVNAGSDVDNVTVYPQLELGSTATPYEPPTVTQTPLPEVELRSLPNGTCDELVIKADGMCEVERRTGYIASYTDEEVTGEYVSTGNGLEAGASIVYELDEPTAEPQSPVTLPALPAPTFNVYHDSQVPSDTSTEYARDINIVLDNLAKQVAGTASAVAVREASTIEKE